MPLTSIPSVDASLAAPSDGVSFRHIAMGDSEIDTLFESGGGFDSFADYVRAERRFQDDFRDIGRARAAVAAWRASVRYSDDSSERARVLRWRDASDQYRRWSAEQVFPSVSRAISSPDGMYELTEPDGGALVPPGFVKELWQKALTADTPMARCKTVVTDTVAGVMPGIFETSRVDGSRWGGLLASWLEEAQQLNSTFPTTANSQYRLKKLGILIPMTDELFMDSPMADEWMTEAASNELRFQCNETIMNGYAGQPNGVVNGPSTVTIAKDTGQASGTISVSNVSNMWQRLWGPCRARAVWYSSLALDVDNIAGLPVSNPTGWTPEQPAPTLKGRYCHPLEHCQAIGTPGDLVLGDFSQQLLVLTGIRKSISMHLKFASFETYMKLILRLDSFGLWPQPITPRHGTATQAPFVVIAQR